MLRLDRGNLTVDLGMVERRSGGAAAIVGTRLNGSEIRNNKQGFNAQPGSGSSSRERKYCKNDTPAVKMWSQILYITDSEKNGFPPSCTARACLMNAATVAKMDPDSVTVN